MNLKLIFIMTIGALLFLFVLQNVSPLEIQFLFWSAQLPRSLFIIILLLIGMVLGWLLHSYRYLRSDRQAQKTSGGEKF